MAWKVELLDSAARTLATLDKPVQKRLIQFLRDRVAGDADPRRIGKALTGKQAGRWRYRVGAYRLICQIEDNRLLVLVLAIGHRGDIYR